MTLSSPQAFMEALDARIASKHVLQHPFYQAWSQGTLSREALQDYAAQYYAHVSAFPAYLSAVHSITPDAATRRVLLQNLIEEEAGSPNHPDLWLQFAEGLGVSQDRVKQTVPAPETAALVDTYRDICRNGSFREGIAALYAYESQIPEVAQSKIDGLQKHYGIEDASTLAYFDVHREADEVHRTEERNLLLHHVSSAADAEKALHAADRSLDALWNLLSGVCHRHNIVCA